MGGLLSKDRKVGDPVTLGEDPAFPGFDGIGHAGVLMADDCKDQENKVRIGSQGDVHSFDPIPALR